MMEHTKEPWIYELPDADHEGIIIGRHGGAVVDGDFNEANARRIVACVNACSGYTTEALEEPGGFMKTLGDALSRERLMQQQRDKLLAAVKRVEESDGMAWVDLLKDIRALIAEVEAAK